MRRYSIDYGWTTVCLLWIGTHLGAREIVVDVNGSAECTTIQFAIWAAHPGDEILVLPGTYCESCVIRGVEDDRGSGLRSDESSWPELYDTIIVGHVYGGVVGPAALVRCEIERNGSVAVEGAHLIDSVVERNRAVSHLQLPVVRDSTLEHCTVIGNTGTWAVLGSVVRSTIAWRNDVQQQIVGSEVSYSCVEGLATGAYGSDEYLDIARCPGYRRG